VDADACKRRNEQRPIRERIPLPGILAAAKRMQPPSRDEGFDELYFVRIDGHNEFVVSLPSSEATAPDA
jgi:hypothetical protein